MSNSTKKLNDAFENISDRFIISTTQYTSQRSGRKRKYIVTAIAAALVLISIVIGTVIASLSDDSAQPFKRPPSSLLPAPPVWMLVSDASNVIRKESVSTLGYKLSFEADYNNTDIDLSFGYVAKEDVCTELLGVLISSLCCFDYSHHFSLFQEEVILSEIYPDVEKSGLSFEDAVKKMNNTFHLLAPFEMIDATFSIKSIKEYDSSQTKNFFDRILARYDLSYEKIGTVVEIALYEEPKVLCGNGLYFEYGYGTEYRFYTYEGEWYVSSEFIDNDLSIDLLYSDPNNENDGFFERTTLDGTVTAVYSGMICVDDDAYIVTDDPKRFKVGDCVTVIFARTYMEPLRESDNAKCKLIRAFSIEKT